MGGQLLHDEVDLPVVQLPAHLLAEEQVVKDGLIAPLVRHDLLLLHAGLVGGGGDVLVLTELGGECVEGGAADLGVPLVGVVVLIEGVAQGVLLPRRAEGGELHVRKLGHIVDLVGCAQGRTQGREHPLRLRLELVGLLPEEVLQIGLAGPALGYGLPQDRLVLGDDLAVDEAQAAPHGRRGPGGGGVPLLERSVAVVHRGGEVAPAAHQVQGLHPLAVLVQAGQDGLRRGQPALVGALDLIRQLPDLLQVRLHGVLAVVDGAQVPCQLHGHVFSLWQLHRVGSPLVSSKSSLPEKGLSLLYHLTGGLSIGRGGENALPPLLFQCQVHSIRTRPCSGAASHQPLRRSRRPDISPPPRRCPPQCAPPADASARC